MFQNFPYKVFNFSTCSLRNWNHKTPCSDFFQLAAIILGYVYAIPDSLSCRHENYSGLVWTETAQNWNKSVTQSNRPFTGAVGRRGFRARENLLLLVFFVISFSISRSCIFCRRLFQRFKVVKLIIQNCKFRKALEQVEIQRNALCKSKVAIFALSSNPHS